jgi:hypothetical protein
MYEWALSRSSYAKISVIATTTATDNNIVSEMKQARQGSRALRLQEDFWQKTLLVRNDGLSEAGCCTCNAAAVFHSIINCKSAWSETLAPPKDRAIASPKVAVGLYDGTPHFMELCCNNFSPL